MTGPDRADASVGEWTPDGIGLLRAVLLAVALVAALLAGLVSMLIRIVPPPPPPVTVQLMDAAGALLEPAIAAPLPTPVTAPAPAAMAAATPELSDPSPVIPAEAAMQPALEASPIPVAPPQAPTPRRQHSAPSSPPVRPIVRPSVRSAPAERSIADLPERITPPATPIERPAMSAPVDVKSGLGPYGAGLHRQIERNMMADRRVAELSVSGTAVIEATIAPDGHLISARLARGSGTRAIDDAALDAMRRGGFPPFGPHMPAGPITIQVPIGVQAE